MIDRPPAPGHTPDDELESIRVAQAIEVGWWEQIPAVDSLDDIMQLIASGEAAVIHDTESYRISERAPQQFNVLRHPAAQLLRNIAGAWKAEIGSPELFLVVTSLARTREYQASLYERGYPTVETSSHTKMVAFDIATKWLADNYPEGERILYDILEVQKQAGTLNFIPEKTMGVVHICVHPSYEYTQ